MLCKVIKHCDEEFRGRDYDNECFICFEYTNETDMNLINLQIQDLYLNTCECRGSVHNNCLKKWFDNNKTCPICRIKVIEYKDENRVIHNYVQLGKTIYRFLSILLFLYALVDLYFMVIRTKYIQYDDMKNDLYS